MNQTEILAIKPEDAPYELEAHQTIDHLRSASRQHSKPPQAETETAQQPEAANIMNPPPQKLRSVQMDFFSEVKTF